MAGKVKPKTCAWVEREEWDELGGYDTHTSCGNSNHSDYSLFETNFKFCPYCGRKIEVKEGK